MRVRHIDGFRVRRIVAGSEGTAGRRPRAGTLGDPVELELWWRLRVARQFVKTFVSVHVDGQVVYVLEVAGPAPDAEFREWEQGKGDWTRRESCVVRVWWWADSWKVLAEETVVVRELRQVETVRENTIVVVVEGKEYMVGGSGQRIGGLLLAPPVATTCLFDIIVKLNNLQFFSDLMDHTHSQLRAEISHVVDRATTLPEALPAASARVELLKKALAREHTAIAELRRSHTLQLHSTSERRVHLRARSTRLEDLWLAQEAHREAFAELVTLLQEINAQVELERVAKGARLARIFRLASRYASLPLPFVARIVSERLDRSLLAPRALRQLLADHGATPELVDAATGYVCLVLAAVQMYTGIPLKYPVQYLGLKLWVVDLVSDETERRYPLHFKDAPLLQYRYGMLLLVRNVRSLVSLGAAMPVPPEDIMASLECAVETIASGGDASVPAALEDESME